MARREAGLTQSELSREVGCKQSALSMFEQGDGTKLNDEVINKLAKKFSIAVTTDEGAVSKKVPHISAFQPGSGFCPNPHCPSNVRHQVAERVLYRPNRAAADPVGGKYCASCGELLERHCPNCGASVHEGAVCSFCGEPYVAVI